MSRTIEKRHRKISSFLKTLREMLNNQPPQYISWGTEQNSFKIKNPSRFSQEVLPKYFKHSNLSSFIRQLNIYDFKKVSNQKYPDQYIYSHPYFDKNNPDLMSNIYRKVHHLPTKHHKSGQQDIHYSSQSFQNSTTPERKKLMQEIEKLKQKLSELQSTNEMICEQNMQLQTKIPVIKNLYGESSKCFYKILMQSYQVQYLKFAEKIHQQLIEQTALINELYQRQKQPEVNAYQFIDTGSKHSMNCKNKSDSTNYNSTSSGGSANGHSYRQKELPVHTPHERLNRKSDKKSQTFLREQNNFNFANSKKFNSQNQILILPQTVKFYAKNPISDRQDSNGLNQEEKMIDESQNSKRENICPEQQTIQSASRCVIYLKNRRIQEQNDRPKIHKAIVLKSNQTLQRGISFAPSLY